MQVLCKVVPHPLALHRAASTVPGGQGTASGVWGQEREDIVGLGTISVMQMNAERGNKHLNGLTMRIHMHQFVNASFCVKVGALLFC